MKKLNQVLGMAAALCAGAALANGSVKGTISYAGPPVKAEMLKRSSDAFCAKTQMADETISLSKDGKTLQNVLVRITNPPAGMKAPPEPVVTVDQKECMYRPRVQGAMEGQKIEFKNSDQTMHNVHAFSGTKTLFNAPQQPKAPAMDKEVKASDVVKLQCDVHPWMKGYVVYSKSPLFAVSGTDGSFEIKDVPAGKYTVEAWHEKLGTQKMEVEVKDGAPAEAKFTFK
ncbi:MAG TPA: carboxypeptidase regulatory-like domain-containing protein [Myxococcales bacterium]|nr:carboxypeptidase regulatory-like domain-containing protein [Myxococcales bacterium]